MAAWVIESNAAVLFYEAMGAVRMATKQCEIGGAPLGLAAYVWQDRKEGRLGLGANPLQPAPAS